MDDEPYSNTELMFESPIDSAPYAGAFFPTSENFVVAGGVFTSNVTNIHRPAPILPSDFRRIPIGDIDLQREIRIDYKSSVIERRHSQASVRRIYSARIRIDGRKSNMTVALYQGNNAEEWLQAISNYSWLRLDKNFASSSGIHAAVFQDDLIPLQHILDVHRHSPLLTVYIYTYCTAEFWEAHQYFFFVSQQYLVYFGCTFWIRRSTGRFCADLAPPDEPPTFFPYMPSSKSLTPAPVPLLEMNSEPTVVSFLTLEQYHEICYLHLAQSRRLSFSTQTTVNPGAIICYSLCSQLKSSVGIAFLPRLDGGGDGWRTYPDGMGEIMLNGWIRYNSCDVPCVLIHEYIELEDSDRAAWMGQANHIFSLLRITSQYEDYGFIESITFCLELASTREHLPPGYLFFCPNTDLRTGACSFRWPTCPAYWSLDPSGGERLSMDDALGLGFPSMTLTTEILGSSWASTVYAGLRQFHQAKDFDPDGQDVARHLGYPLYQLYNEVETPSAHVEDEFAGAEIHDDSPEKDEHGHELVGSQHVINDFGIGDDAEDFPLSPSCHVLMFAKFMLMFFLALSSLYEYAW